MTKLRNKDVEHVAKLANLRLTQTEVKKFTKQLSEVITYVSELEKVDTSSCIPTSQTTGIENASRFDQLDMRNNLNHDEAISGSEKTNNGYFVVPMILEERTDY